LKGKKDIDFSRQAKRSKEAQRKFREARGDFVVYIYLPLNC